MTVCEYKPIYPFGFERLHEPYFPISQGLMLNTLDDYDVFYGNGFVDSWLDSEASFENNVEWHENQLKKSVTAKYNNQPIC